MAGVLGTISGRVTLDVRKAVAGYAALRAQNARTVYAMRGTGDSFMAAGQRMAMAGGVMVYAFSRVVNAASEFERKMDFFGAVQKTSAREMAKLKDEVLNLAKTSIYSADAIAEGVVELGKAGVDAQMIMKGLGQAMVNLGAAGDIPLAESGRMITSTIQQFDLSARRAVDVVDMLAGSANASIVDIADLGVSLKYVGGVASAVGLSFEDTLTAISLLGKAGIRGSTAGTSLRQMLVSLGGATGPATESLTELGIITEDGNNKFFTAEGRAKSLSRVFQILQDSTAKLTQKQRLMHLRTIFNNRALSAASILTREGSKGFREMYKEMSKVSAADVASQRLDNLSGDLEILQSNIDSMMIRAGGPFQETMRQWVQVITRLVQAFDEMDPATQKMVIQGFALTGVALVAMGAFSMFIGTIFRFVAASLKMAAGIKFLVNLLKIVIVNARWAVVLFGGQLAAALGLTTGALLLVVAAAAAFIAAWVLAYKKIEPFRNAVNAWYGAIWKAMKAFGSFIQLLATDPGAAWDKIKAGAQKALDWIVEGFKKLPGLISQGVDIAAGYVRDFTGAVVDYFADLASKALGKVGDFVSSVTSLFTFRNAGYAIGYLVGTAVRLFSTLGLRVVSLVGSLAGRVVSFFAQLPPRIGYLIGFLVGKAVGLMLRFQMKMLSLAAKLVVGVVKFFQKLPGRVASFVVSMVTRNVTLFAAFAARLPSLAAQLVTGVINFFRTLPARVAAFIINLVNRSRALFNRWKTNAVNMAEGMAEGFMDQIRDLPSLVAGIAGDIIQAFKDRITEAASAVRDFGKGMWEGFKDGIGMNSPSYFEKAAWQITGVLDEETKKMAKKTMEIQKLSKKLADTKLTVGGDLGATSSTQKYARLASMQSRNQNRARTLMAASGRRTDRPLAASGRNKKPTDRLVEGELRLSPDGRAFIRGVAQEAIDDNDSFYETINRM